MKKGGEKEVKSLKKSNHFRLIKEGKGGLV
ncbi:hypothetical protein O163_02175 [Caldanaerobacter subterraneus subsp. yonseiensis KB-1]|uniref:Uncharacterized protein n=1 Tax=Caldanaerobacter subterraneus subsp. yonseiensis KB-1 TaxID=1388761 RepID=U5CVV7_CALSX|nr:hypothetical protein O163_02175 [Caldanaerobacter subterraneus subsp. yonseiensis KB-1]